MLVTRAAAVTVALAVICAGCTGKSETKDAAESEATTQSARGEWNLSVGIEPEHGVPGKTVAPQYFHGDQGDQFRIVISGEQDGFVYALNRGSSGDYMLLFPNRAAQATNNRLEAGKSLKVPTEESGEWLRYSGEGAEELTVFFAPDRIDPLEELYEQAPVASADVQRTMAEMQEKRPPGDHITQKETEEAVVFTFAGGPDATWMSVNVKLHHD